MLCKYLLPTDKALAGWPKQEINKDAAARFTSGQAVSLGKKGNFTQTGRVRVYSCHGEQFLGVGELTSDGTIAPRRIFQIATIPTVIR